MTSASLRVETDAAETLVSRAAAGDEVAFTRIVAAHHADMLRIAQVVCGDVDQSADAVQIAWSIAWRRLGSLRDAARLRPWLMSIAANEARQSVRRRGRQSVREIPVVDVGGLSPDAALASRIDLHRALQCLNARDRVLLALRFGGGLDSNEIGRVVGMSATAVRSRLKRAVDRLRKELSDD